jgi:Putative transposase of IS4/5 family (DUF4096)
VEGEPCGAQWHPVVLRTGAPWADLPERYPSYQTCHRRFQQWVRDQGYLDLQEAFIDGSFAPAKQGGACVGKTKRGKGSKIMAIADRQGLPVAVHVESATPHEVTLCTPHSRSGLSVSSRCVSSATTPTSRTDWMRNWRAVAWN